MAFLQDIGEYLEDLGVGTVGTNLFLGEMPESPNSCIALYQYAGETPITTHDGGVIEKPGLQVKVRDPVYATGMAKIGSIFDALHKLANTRLEGTGYLSFFAVQSPYPLGRDASNRMEWVQNFIVTKGR